MMGRRQQLEWLMEYQLRLATRYRFFVSLILVAPRDKKVNVNRLLEETLRDCDLLFDLQERSAILMSHTGVEEACKAVERYQSLCNGKIDLRFGLASFPDDARAVANMLETAEGCLAEAQRGGRGTLVHNAKNVHS